MDIRRRMMALGMMGGGKPIFDVKVYGGAVGDGATDDTTAVQNTLDAAAAASGICYFPAGTYSTSHLSFPANVTVQGVPTYGSPRPTIWASELVSKTGYTDNYCAVTGNNVVVKWMSFNGNRATATSNGAFYGDVGVDKVLVDSCYFHNSYLEGLQTASSYWTVQNCTFDDNDYGLCFLTATSVGCVGSNNLFTNTRGVKGSIYLGNGANNNTIINNTIDGTGGSILKGVNIGGDSPYSSANVVQGNTFTNCKVSVYIQQGAFDNIINGNTITAGAYSTSNAILVNNDAGTGNIITNNTINNWSATYSIYIRKETTRVNGNIVTGSGQVKCDASPGEFKNNIITSGTSTGAYLGFTATGLEISGNVITLCYLHGMYIGVGDLTSALIQNNICNNNGQDGTASRSGMSVARALVTTAFVGNTCTDTQGTKTQKYGVDIATGSTGTYTADNLVTGNISASRWDGLTAI